MSNPMGDWQASLWLATGLFAMVWSADCSSAVAIEIQRTTLPSTIADPVFQRIDFVSDVFVVAGVTPLVFSISTSQGPHSCSLRLRSVDTTGFEAACVEPPGFDGPHTTIDLHYIAIEAGVHTAPATVGGMSTTVKLAAGSTSTVAVQHNCASGCGPSGSTSVAFGTAFTAPPALLLQIQSLNSESGTPPAGPSMPFLVGTTVEDGAGVPIISTTGFEVALERSEVNLGVPVPEDVGWLAVEPTSGCTLLDLSAYGGPASVPFEAIITPEVIDGWDDGCDAGEGATFSAGCFASPPVVVGHKRTRNGADGGWLRRCGSLTSSAVRFTVDEDTHRDAERSHTTESASLLAFDIDFSTPVSLATFMSERDSRGVRFAWTTAAEVGHVAFELAEDSGRGWRVLETLPALDGQVDGLEPRSYAFEHADVRGNRFRLTDIDRFGRRRHHGPFVLGERFGRSSEQVAIDWASVRAEVESARLLRAKRALPPNGVPSRLELRVSQTGIHRITSAVFSAAGFDLSTRRTGRWALLLGGEPMPLRIVSSGLQGTFGSDGFIEFWGQAVDDSLYTRTRAYVLEIDGGSGLVMPLASEPIPSTAPAGAFTARHWDDEDRYYSFGSPNGDPWYRDGLRATGSGRAWDFPLVIDALASDGEGSRLELSAWGVTDFPQAPDHHLIVDLNGHRVWEGIFDGLTEVRIDERLPAGVLRQGDNTLTLTMPNDLGLPVDLIHLEGFGARYGRPFVALDDRLVFEGRGAVFQVSGLREPDVVAYRIGAQGPVRLPVSMARERGSYVVRFAGDPNGNQRYWVSTTSSLNGVDEIRLETEEARLDGPASYLIIAHPLFLDHLAPLVAARQADGYSVAVVDVESIYARFSHGVIAPEAIRQFIAEAVDRHRTRMVLLVGADTYDYFDHHGVGSVSLIPTPYAATDALIRFAPVDALLADVDGDGLPDLPIGRLPVRTPTELRTVVDKTLSYGQRRDAPQAVFASDDREPFQAFEPLSRHLATLLPAHWQRQHIDLDVTPISVARDELLAALGEGPELVSFVGHAGPTRWTFEGLLSAADVTALENGRPMVVVQGGCWTTYHVHPTSSTLAHRFLLGAHGAAAVLGAGTLTRGGSEEQLQKLFFRRLRVPGTSIGEAFQQAKALLARRAPSRLDALLGWSLLGDPALVVEP